MVARSDGCAVDILAGGDEELHLNKSTPHLRRRKDFGAKCWIKEIVAKMSGEHVGILDKITNTTPNAPHDKKELTIQIGLFLAMRKRHPKI